NFGRMATRSVKEFNSPVTMRHGQKGVAITSEQAKTSVARLNQTKRSKSWGLFRPRDTSFSTKIRAAKSTFHSRVGFKATFLFSSDSIHSLLEVRQAQLSCCDVLCAKSILHSQSYPGRLSRKIPITTSNLGS